MVKSVTLLCLEGTRFKISIGRPAVFRHFMVFISSSSKIPEIRLIYVLQIHYLLPYFRSLIWNRKLEKIQMNSCDSLSKKGDINVRLHTRHATSLTFPVYRTAIRRSTLCSFNPLALKFFFFLILAHAVYKIWIIQEPNKLALWNKLHFEEKKRRV